MEFQVRNAIEILSRTPATVELMLGDLSDEWTDGSDRDSWTPFDVLGHLIHGERTDWIPRAKIILDQGENRTFAPFDRFAQFEDSKEQTLRELLSIFAELRKQNIEMLLSWNLVDENLKLLGIHPELGEVSLEQLLSTWVVHDLNHISQIARGLAGRYSGNVGVWRQYLSILQ